MNVYIHIYDLLNNKCLINSMNRIQSKDHKIGIYEKNNISLSCFDDKIYMQIDRCDGLALGYYLGKVAKEILKCLVIYETFR